MEGIKKIEGFFIFYLVSTLIKISKIKYVLF